MTTYEMQWGRNDPVLVSTVEDFDGVVQDVETLRGDGAAPFQVSIAAVDDGAGPFDQEGLDIGVGHRERAFAFWAGAGGGWGHEPGVATLSEALAFDLGGQWTEYYPDQIRVTAETAKVAARQFIETGQRPTCLEWDNG